MSFLTYNCQGYMKKIFNLTLIVIALIGCTGNLQSLPQVTGTIQATKIIPISEKPTWNVYDPDSDHIWNRAFRQFYRRTTNDGKEYGLGELDPLLWFDTTYLLSGDSYQQAIQILDEFLAAHAENLIDDALRRAMFQRDLWAVFDWLACQSDPYPFQRQALETRLAQIIKGVALTTEEILSLPDNYTLAVQSNAFPAAYQADNPEAAFLPGDLFESNSAWVSMGREGGPVAITHTNEFPFFGRSVFLVFVRSPDGRKATLEFIHSLTMDPHPDFKIGSEVALVRRMLLIDDQGNPVLSPLVETIQIRHFSPAQVFHEFELDRTRLLSGDANTLRLKTDLFMLFLSHGDVFERDHGPELRAAIPDICKACHFNIPGVFDSGDMQSHLQAVLSYSRANFPLPDNQRPILYATTWANEAQTVIEWKYNHNTWRSLKALWNQ
jgi:hypothetical protein